jgi:hypothetical protein
MQLLLGAAVLRMLALLVEAPSVALDHLVPKRSFAAVDTALYAVMQCSGITVQMLVSSATTGGLPCLGHSVHRSYD